MNRQTQKYHLSLAGEFYVAAELQRRGVSAAVTYGNAKSADVVAFSTSGEKAVVIEVKSTAQAKWVVGGKIPAPSSKPWVFVHVPEDPKLPPSFFVLLQEELHQILAPLGDEYRRKYKEKHGIEYGDRAGVENLTKKQAEPFHDAWSKILDQLLT
jgi:hypothetical protein